jgi:hypothetical protein
MFRRNRYSFGVVTPIGLARRGAIEAIHHRIGVDHEQIRVTPKRDDAYCGNDSRWQVDK